MYEYVLLLHVHKSLLSHSRLQVPHITHYRNAFRRSKGTNFFKTSLWAWGKHILQSILHPVLIVNHYLLLNMYAVINLGKGMSYIPGAASLAATHRGKVKNIRLTTLRDANQNVDHRTCILDFEKEAIAFDKKQRQQCADGGEHLIEYASLGHPYIKDYSLTASLNWVLLMNPLMIDLLSRADFIEVDVTYKASVQFEYLLNAVTFNYTTMRCKSHNYYEYI